MKIVSFARWESIENFLSGKPADFEIYENYQGLVDLCDRAAQSAAANAGKTAATTAADLGQSATQEQASLSPFYSQEMKTQHEFSPEQTNELLTNALAGSGGATGALKGSAEQEAARMRNPSGFTKSLDELARDQQKTAAGASEGIAAQDVLGAKQLNQQGAAGEAGLYGENLKGQLSAMGQAAPDINAGINAENSGWEQQLEGGLNTAANLTKAYKG